MTDDMKFEFDQLLRAIRDGEAFDEASLQDEAEQIRALIKALDTLDLAEIEALVEATGGGVDTSRAAAGALPARLEVPSAQCCKDVVRETSDEAAVPCKPLRRIGANPEERRRAGEHPRTQKRNMARRARATDSEIVIRPLQEDMIGIANLLFVAMSSIRVHCADGVCIAYLNECIAHIVKRYRIPTPKSTDGAPVGWAAVMRMLDYARTEMLHKMVDADVIDLIDVCIGRLPRIESTGEEEPRSLLID
jgi:hypothetical protein